MLIIREDSHYLNYSFYLNRNGTTIGVWYDGSHLQYHHYNNNTPIDFLLSYRRESFELD